jgi:hypothetical protein
MAGAALGKHLLAGGGILGEGLGREGNETKADESKAQHGHLH